MSARNLPVPPRVSFLLTLLCACATVGRAGGISEAEALETLYAEEWEYLLTELPDFATQIGDRRYNDRLPDESLEAIERRKAHDRELSRKLQAFHPERLEPEDRLDFELFKRGVDEGVEEQRFPVEDLPLNQFGGPQEDLTQLARQHPKLSRKDLEDWLKRLEAVPRLIDQVISRLRHGLEAKVTTPKVVLELVRPELKAHLVADPTKAPLYALVFDGLASSASAEEVVAIQREAQRIVREQVTPAFARFDRFFEDEYFPKARGSVGWSDLPDGAAWYAFRAKRHTTTDKSPEEIHRMGLAEVQRIGKEMERIKDECKFKGTLDAFFEHLRTDDRFFYKDAAALLAGYRDIAKRIDPQLVTQFTRLPRLPYGVAAIPAHSERGMPTAYYERGSLAAGRAGYFYANTWNLRARPKWEMQALTLHEAVPGHHLQLALAQEQEELPLFRRYSHYTAFIEGWGLYAESLGADLGVYRDPYDRFGQLNNEMWRAIRLVVDTGLHAKGWSREQAIDYFTKNSGRAREDVAVEVDRYIATAGQALAYKLGQLKISELRRRAESALGSRFDVRAFHDFVLGEGGLPLDVLDRRVSDWIARLTRRLPGTSGGSLPPGSDRR